MTDSQLIVGIDASNIRSGGGVTHLVELLSAASPGDQGIAKVVLWCGPKTMALIPDRPWLSKQEPAVLGKTLAYRAAWQRFGLQREIRRHNCDVLFVPGGTYAGEFAPTVCLSQNLLPFERRELNRFWPSLSYLKFRALEITQTPSFKQADGLVFLTNYARDIVTKKIGKFKGTVTCVPHGINKRFFHAPRLARQVASCTPEDPFRILYVSILDMYKHQWHVIEAVSQLRRQGLPVHLELVGPATPKAMSLVDKAVAEFDPQRQAVSYRGAISFDELHTVYQRADLGLFASSCENMPLILLEKMAAGLPIACSDRGPMPEILGSAGEYFDPEHSEGIAKAIEKMFAAPEQRFAKAKQSYEEAMRYNWDTCAAQTFDFLSRCAINH